MRVPFLARKSGTRAVARRTSLISSLSTTLDVNVLALDYRGFGDSTGVPSQAGLVLDARTAWRWILDRNGGEVSRVAVVGQSIGTGVASLMVAQLASEGQSVELPALAAIPADPS